MYTEIEDEGISTLPLLKGVRRVIHIDFTDL